MVLKGVSWVQNDKIKSNGFERSQLGIQCKKSYLVLKGVSWVLHDKMRLYGLDRSQLGTQ